MEHFRRAEAVENVDAIAFAPAPPDIDRQRFAGRDAAAQLERGAVHRVRREKGGIEGRHGEEHGDAVLAQQRGDRFRRRPSGHQHRGRAGRQRKAHGVAEAIGEEQLRHRIDDVVLGEADHRRAIEVVGQPRRGMHMHRALGLAGRARGVEPEADVVAGGRRREVRPLGRLQRVLEQRVAVALLPRHDHVFEVRARSDQAGEARIKLLGHDQKPGAAVVEHEPVIGLAQQRVHGNGDDASLDGAEKRGRPVDGVEEADQDALLARDAERAQQLAEPRDAVGELPIGPAPARIDIGGLAGAPGGEIAGENVLGKIVAARNGGDRGGGRRGRRRHILGIHVPHRILMTRTAPGEYAEWNEDEQERPR